MGGRGILPNVFVQSSYFKVVDPKRVALHQLFSLKMQSHHNLTKIAKWQFWWSRKQPLCFVLLFKGGDEKLFIQPLHTLLNWQWLWTASFVLLSAQKKVFKNAQHCVHVHLLWACRYKYFIQELHFIACSLRQDRTSHFEMNSRASVSSASQRFESFSF